jgi:hypothetical protein
MEVQKDFRDLLALFNAHDVEYLIVGGYALAFHGVPRFTGDIDLYVKPGKENSKKIISALNAFGFSSTELTVRDFQSPDKIIQLGVVPVRIDLVTSLSGVTWEEAFKGREKGQYGDVPVFYIGRKELIKNKRSSGRIKDKADLEALGEK